MKMLGDKGLSARGFKSTPLLRLSLLGLVAFLVLYPLGMLLYGSFRDNMPGLPGGYTLQGYAEVYLNPATYGIIWTTVRIALGSTVLAIVIVVFLCWLIHRTNAPGRRMLDTVLHINFFLLAPLPMLLGWTFLYAPKSGIINQFFIGHFGFPLFNIFSIQGIILAGVSFGFSFFYIFLSPAFKSMDISMEEAAKTSGASTFATLRKVTLPLLLPAITAATMMAFVRSMEAFESVIILGRTANISVMATQVYDYINNEPPDYPAAMAMGVTLLLITFLLVLLQWRILGRREFITITGKGYRPRPMDLGRWRWPFSIMAILTIGILTVPPMFMLIQSTFMKKVGMYGPDAYTLKNYVLALTDPNILDALKNTVILGVVSATVGVLIYMLVSYIVTKTRFREGRALDIITWIPWAVPSIVLALGLLWAYILLPLPFGIILYGTLTLLIVAIITKGFAIGTKTIGSSMIQVSKELEESARISGASWIQTLFRIWIPVLKNGMITTWLLIFAFAVRDLATVVLIYGTNSRVLTTIFFGLWQQGKMEAASVVGLLQALLIIIAYVLLRLLSRGGIKEMTM